MGTGSRKTWLERQPDDLQMFVLSLDDEGRTLEEISARIRERTGERVPVQTLHHSLAKYQRTIGREEKLAMLLARRQKAFFKENPDVDPAGLARFFLSLRVKELESAPLSGGALVAAAQQEAWLKLREQELEIKREQTRLKRRQIELLRERLRAARAKAEKVLSDEKASPAEIRRRVREIFGLLDEPARAARSAAAVSGEVGS